MRSFLLRVAAMAVILAPACGQDTVRINNNTKAVISPVPFRVGQSAVDPTAPGNGSIWYDTATNALKARVNGATISLGTTTITGGNTQVMFFDGANTPAGDAGMTYAKTTDTLTVSNLDASIITGDVTVDGDITVGSINLTGPITFPDDVRNVFNPGATVAGLNVGGFAGNPSTPINGDIWYDSTANTLDARINGATVNLGAGSSITGADTQVTFFDGANNPAGDAGITYAKATDTLTVGDLAVVDGSFTLGGFTFTAPASGGTIVTTGTLSTGGLAGAFTTLSATGALTLSAGSQIAPSVNFGDSDTGFWAAAAGNISVSVNNNERYRFGSGGSLTTLELSLGSPAVPLVFLQADGAATLQLGADATTGVNQKLKAMDASAGTGGNLTLAAGTGTSAGGALILQTAATGTLTDRLTIAAAGAATFSGALNVNGNMTAVGGLYYLATNALIGTPAAGVIRLSNFGATDLDRIQGGGTTSSFPSFKRVGAEWQVAHAATTAAMGVAAVDAEMTFIEDRYRRKGSGSPEGAITAPIGAIYHRTDGGDDTSVYSKISGTGNTGWKALENVP